MSVGMNDIAQLVSQKEGVSVSKALKMVKTVIESFEDVLVREKKVSLVGHFTAEVKVKKGREYRVPSTGELVTTEDKNVVRFKASSTLERRVNE